MRKKIKAGKKGGVDIYSSNDPNIISSHEITKSKLSSKEDYMKYKETMKKDMIELRNINNYKHKFYFKPLQEDIYSRLPEIYKLLITYIFNNYKKTNNGIIYNDYKIKNENYTITKYKGGASINRLSDNNIITDLTNYCRDTNTDENDISNLLQPSSSSPLTINNYNYLKDFITSNKTSIEKKYSFPLDPIYNYNDSSTYDSYSNFEKQYSCFEYNKDIVTAYEREFLNEENQKSLQEFIEEQKNYIAGLNKWEKRIIQDYISEYSFNFYGHYKSGNIARWNENTTKNFGDAFYYQIAKLYSHKLSLDQYNEWLNNDRLPYNQDSIIQLTKEEWQKVLDEFMKDLNIIIIKAPPVKKPIYCYRGVSEHYIKDGTRINPRQKSYISERLSSFSLNFNTSKQFAFLGDENKRSVYRITILPQCRVLHITQLSIYDTEIEIICPSNSIFYYDIDVIGNDFKPIKAYNNINKKYGICSHQDDAFESFDSILAITPQPTPRRTLSSLPAPRRPYRSISSSLVPSTLHTLPISSLETSENVKEKASETISNTAKFLLDKSLKDADFESHEEATNYFSSSHITEADKLFKATVAGFKNVADATTAFATLTATTAATATENAINILNICSICND